MISVIVFFQILIFWPGSGNGLKGKPEAPLITPDSGTPEGFSLPQGRGHVRVKRSFEIMDFRYNVPLPYCGRNCKRSSEPFDLDSVPSGDYRSEESQISALTMAIPDPNAAGLPQDGKPPPVKNIVSTVLLPYPDEEPFVPPALPEGNSVCNIGDSGKSEGGSPIALGRATKWKIKSQGSGATKELSKTGQVVSVNEYYGRMRDRFYMENDGYNLIFYLNETQPTSELTIKIKEWDDEYVFAKGILHWGSTDAWGSEHIIHGQRFPLEIQFVHYKSSLRSLERAMEVKYGVMIASVVCDFSGFEKSYLDAIIRNAAGFAQPGGIKQVHGPLYMAGMFPGTLEHYEYSGSFTTAPCGKIVRRIVFSHTVGIGRDQLEVLRKVMRNGNGAPMVDNYRKIQDVGGRQILFNPTFGQFKVKHRESLVKPQVKRHW